MRYPVVFTHRYSNPIAYIKHCGQPRRDHICETIGAKNSHSPLRVHQFQRQWAECQRKTTVRVIPQICCSPWDWLSIKAWLAVCFVPVIVSMALRQTERARAPPRVFVTAGGYSPYTTRQLRNLRTAVACCFLLEKKFPPQATHTNTCLD